MAQSESKERRIVWFLCVLAALHVVIFSAAFPFFNNVDESNHFDLVVKYGAGHPPQKMNIISAEAMRYIAIFGSQEFLWSTNSFSSGRYPPPPWTQSLEVIRRYVEANELNRSNIVNYEDSQPPVYYTASGAWWRLGKGIGLEGIGLLYWLRFMNAIVVGALVWVGWFAARSVFSGNYFITLAVPALIAFMPQSAFYSIENDVMSPLCFGTAFLCLLKFRNQPEARWGIATGVLLAATYLVKISDIPLVLAALVIAWLPAMRTVREVRPLLPYAWLTLFAAGPIILWSVWSKTAFGDFTGAAAKVQILGWSRKPIAEWFHHPIFTPHGFWTFLSGLIATFWQGEIFWHRTPLSLSWLNNFYVFLTLTMLGAGVIALFRKPAATDLTQNRSALWLSLVFLSAAVAFLGFLSLIYDFHDCFYPSREHPYFSSGRLMLGALIPFALLFVYGFHFLTRRLGEGWKFRVFAGMILLMLAGETITDWPVFFSLYNWFHA